MSDGRTLPLKNLKKALRSTLKQSCRLTDNPNVLGLGRRGGDFVLVLADFMSLVYLYNYKLTKKKVYLLKCLYYFFIERYIYPKLKYIVVQTEKEISHAKCLGLKNVGMLTNYVKKNNSSGLSMPDKQLKIRFGVIATFENIYKIQTQEIVDYVDKHLFDQVEVVLAGKSSDYIVGRSVVHLGVVNEVREFYEKIDVALCFSWKDYGFINKLAEAVSHNRPVICNLGALNRMEYLAGLKSCMVVEKYSDLSDVREILKLRDDPDVQADCLLANKLVQERLGLKSYMKNVRQLVNEVNSVN